MEIHRHCGKEGKGRGDTSILRYERNGTWRYIDTEVRTERHTEESFRLHVPELHTIL
jgi:hypothetical protein